MDQSQNELLVHLQSTNTCIFPGFTASNETLVNLAVGEVPPDENIIYAIFVAALDLHKIGSPKRFIVLPQQALKWKPGVPNDHRKEVPDIGIGNVQLPNTTTVPPTPAQVKLRSGFEAKKAVVEMTDLPPPATIIQKTAVTRAFQIAYFQAEDQAKAAIKGGFALEATNIIWVVAVGPYWTHYRFGPYTKNQLGVRAHRPSDSADWEAQVEIELAKESPPPPLPSLFLLGTPESYQELESLISSTDHLITGQNYLICVSIQSLVPSARTNEAVSMTRRGIPPVRGLEVKPQNKVSFF
jgi:hypothetical protein